MPQFDPTFYLAQIFWMLVSFCLLWGVMQWVITPLLKKIRGERKTKLQQLITEAQNLQEEADIILKENQEALDVARQEALSIIQEAETYAQTQYQNYLHEAQNLYQAQLLSIQQTLDKEKEEIIKNLDTLASPLAKLFVEKIEKEEGHHG